MLTTNHVLVGAVAGKMVGNPYIAFPVGIFLHLVFDKVPHFWPTGKKGRAFIVVADTAVSILLLGFFYVQAGGASSSIFWGALGGFMVDALLVGLKPFVKSKVISWHSIRQIHVTKPIILSTDVLTTILCVGYFVIKGI